jgi:hypothetical protein
MSHADRIRTWRAMDGMGFSLIPLRGKKPVEKDWSRWCREKRPFREMDFRNRNAGVCCGPASDILVVDVDSPELFADWRDENGYRVPETRTHQTGSGLPHFLFKYPSDGRDYGNKSLKKHGFDVRGVGGQVVCPPSTHPSTGLPYRVLRDIPIAEAPKWLLGLYEEPKSTAEPIPSQGRPSPWTGSLDDLRISAETRRLIVEGAPKGQRSEALFSVLMALVGAGLSDDQVIGILEAFPIGQKFRERGNGRVRWIQPQITKARRSCDTSSINNTCVNRGMPSSQKPSKTSPSKPSTGNQRKNMDAVKCRQALSSAVSMLSNAIKEERERHGVTQEGIDFIAELAETYTPPKSGPRQITREIREWVQDGTGTFLTADLSRELNLTARDGILRQATKVLCRLVDEGLIERVGSKRGMYRRIEQSAERIDFMDAPTGNYEVKYPFAIEELVETHPGNLVVVAGSPNSGKTALLLNIARMNQARHEVHYYSSEMGAAELRKRLEKFPMKLSDWRVNFWERSSDFADIVRPDCLNIVDFLEVHEDFWEGRGVLKALHDRLHTACVFSHCKRMWVVMQVSEAHGRSKNPGCTYRWNLEGCGS